MAQRNSGNNNNSTLPASRRPGPSSGGNRPGPGRGNSGNTRSSNTNTRKPSSGGSRTSGNRNSGNSGSRGNGGYESDGSERILFTVVLIGIALLLMLCNFGICGGFGDAVSGFLFGAFGFEAYIAPIFIVGMVMWYMFFSSDDDLSPIRMTGAVLLFIVIGIFSDMISGNSASLAKYNIGDIYRLSAEGKNGGGVISGSLSYALHTNLGTAGEVIVCILILILCLFAINKTFFSRLFKGMFFGMVNGSKELVRRSVERSEERRLAIEENDHVYELPDHEMDEDGAYRDDYGDETTEDGSPREAMTVTEKMQRGRDKNKKSEPSKVPGIIDKFVNNRIERSAEDKAKKEQEKKVREETKDAESILDVRKSPERGQQFIPHHTGEMHEMSYSKPDDPYDDDFSSESEEKWNDSRNSLGFNYDTPGSGNDNPSVTTDDHPAEEPVLPVVPDSLKVSVNSDHKIRVTDNEPEEVVEPEEEFPVPEPAPSAPYSKPASAVKPERASISREPAVQPAASKAKPSGKKYKYNAPSLDFLKKNKAGARDAAAEIKNVQNRLIETLSSFGIEAEMGAYSQGPTVTRYEFTVSQGTKLSRVVGLSDEIKMALAATDIRIEAPIPGKSAIGIEVPNSTAVPVLLGDLLSSGEYQKSKDPLSFAVGKDIEGKTVVTNIAKFPHVLIAGTTGSGKSVCINTLILSLLYKSSPEDVQLILVDPKVVELKIYNGIPHLPFGVVTKPRAASEMLDWAVAEMERRYRAFADREVRDIEGYNQYVEDVNAKRRDPLPIDEHPETDSLVPALRKMPRVVIIIDELADLMMVAAKEVEKSICRLAQLARAAGMHLVVATQRPSVDVITGLIKTNLPSRIAFAVSSGVDSRTVLDQVGAEKLLGKGDMLFYPQGKMKPDRLQGAFVSDEEVLRVTGFLKAAANDPTFHNPLDDADGINELKKTIADIEAGMDPTPSAGSSSQAPASNSAFDDELFVEAGLYIIRSKKASIGYLQRVLKIGFNRAARIMDSLADEGVVGQEQGTKPRDILMTEEMFNAFVASKQNPDGE